MSKNGYLVISLDFELLWGIFDVVEFSEKEKYIENTRKIIPELLELFKENEIHCTWATVGMLINQDWEEWRNNEPKSLPSYSNEKLSAYDFGDKNSEIVHPKFCFAPELVQKIVNTPFQELASHTYSHYYCNEEGQNLEQFEADLLQMNKMAQKLGVKIRSLVFPRNQFNENYLKICAENGIETVRSNPSDWYWKDTTGESLISKLFRTGDAYFPLGKRKSYTFSELKKDKKLPLAQKASRFFRPVEKDDSLHKLKLDRIKREINSAAKKGEIYHLWWHPHNFGERPEESLRDLKEIIDCFLEKEEKYGFRSATMQEISKVFSVKSTEISKV